jgi:hypothetical protein
MKAGESSVMSTDISKWISGETDAFFDPGKPQKRSPFTKRTHSGIAIAVAVGCVFTVIGFVSSKLLSAQAPNSAPSAHVPSQAKPPAWAGISALPVPSPEVARTPFPAPPASAADNQSTFKPVIRLPVIRIPNEPQSNLTEQANAFMKSYWESVEEPSDRVLPYLNSIYAPMVTYYGKLTPKEVVLRDKYYFLKRWPIRQTWEAESPTVSCNQAAAECEIAGVRKYKAMSVDRGSHTSGMVRYAYAIRFSEGSPQIVVEDSKTVR